ncbi:MAG: hypothetical protein Q8P15_03885 [Nanoarchaeota archaeon]|nr:hypothetical protein [Nanoarchaeota archaeon]
MNHKEHKEVLEGFVRKSIGLGEKVPRKTNNEAITEEVKDCGGKFKGCYNDEIYCPVIPLLAEHICPYQDGNCIKVLEEDMRGGYTFIKRYLCKFRDA